MKVAIRVKEQISRTGANQAVYMLDPPLEGVRCVIASGVHNPYAHEVMLFKGSPEGEIVDFTELAAIKDTTRHSELFDLLGYEIKSGKLP